MSHLSARFLRFTLLPFLLAMTGISTAVADDLTASSGRQIFVRFCASCHGNRGEGDGPVAPSLKVLPPDLTRLSRRSGGTYPAELLRRIIDGRAETQTHGSRQMPVWGLEFKLAAEKPAAARAASQVSIEKLVEYLRTIQK